jgi:hypothetical protein
VDLKKQVVFAWSTLFVATLITISTKTRGGVLIMKVSRAIRKIVALGIGASMMGATILGATAADLANYPTFFLDGGTYDGVIVASGAVDSLASVDIAANMFYAGEGSSSTVAVSGDAWQVRTVSDYMEYNESVGPSSQGVVDFIDDDELAALADGQISNEKGTFTYEQFLHFNNSAQNVLHEEDDEDVTALFFKIPDGTNVARYSLEFTEAVESDIDASSSFEMDDLEGRDINLFGVNYNIVQARHGGTANSAQVKLILMGGSVRDTLRLEETKTYTLDGVTFDAQLAFVDATQAKFIVNGESTRLMEDGETYRLSDGTTIGVSEILYQDYAGGIQSVEFFLGANKLELKDSIINDSAYGSSLKVDEETIDDATVRIVGTIKTTPTASVDGELDITSLEVNMVAEDDFWVPVDGKLSQNPNMREPVLFTQNWDMEFKGLSDDPRTTMKLRAKRSEEEYWITFTNTQGNEIEFPLVYGKTSGQLLFGAQDDRLELNKTSIDKKDYFILNDATDEKSISHIVQYRGADKRSASNPKMKFKIIGTGETVDRSYDITTGQATLKLSGTTYTFTNRTGLSDATDDFQIQLTGGNAATFFNTTNSTAGGYGDVVFTQYGGQIGFYQNGSNTTGSVYLNITAFDTDTFDDHHTVAGTTSRLPQFSARIAPEGTEVDLTNTTGPVFTTPDDQDDKKLGYTRYGAFVDVTSPSGTGTSADTFDITYPSRQSEALVYVTTKAAALSTSTSGGNARVTIPVTATKLPEEVTDVSAQNIISVGGPCANSVTAAAMYTQQGLAVPADCSEGFTPGEAIISLYDVGDNVALVAAGYSGDDTRRAGKVLAQASRYGLSGSQVTVTGTTFEDISVTKVS